MKDLTGKDIDRYHIIEKLGQGGMAVVYHAYDTRLERDVAIKFIRVGLFGTEVITRVLKRFEKEGKALAKFSHGNIVQIYDYGEYEGVPYLVMEYLPGGTLKDLTGKTWNWPEAVRLLEPVAQGLAYAHAEGVIHRDVKPSNILLNRDGEPKLSDFGIARILEGDESATLSGTGFGMGTPEYMAPEQAQSKALDGRVDVYALGVVLYELVTGRKPYTADTPLAVIIKQVNDPLPRPGEFVKGLPPDVEQVLYKALAKDPENRYENMQTFAAALQKLLLLPQANQDLLDESEPSLETAQEMQEGEAFETLDNLFVELNEKITPKQSRLGLPVWAWAGAGGGLLLVSLIILFLFGGDGNRGLAFQASEPPALTETCQPTLTDTQEPTGTPTVTFTQTITPTVTLTHTPTIEMGSTKVSELDGMVMVYVPAGEFIMGSEDGESNQQPAHTVYLDAYWIDQTEVTNAMYAKFLNEMANQDGKWYAWMSLPDSYIQIRHNGAQWVVDNGKEDYPIVKVSWYGAQAYCDWAGRQLPSEAQWEKAARGTDGRIYPWGEGISCDLANNINCAAGTMKTGSFPDGASPYGALDMAGNVWEWVNDWYQEDYYSISPASNPTGPQFSEDQLFTLRGGSWVSYGNLLFSTLRLSDYYENSHYDVGFRCLLPDSTY